ncbi:MAG: GNAT family N-acetyltransferase [Candidatus Hodarchaeales archaeon]|jgi:N-acetylglutamate synthase-like GNAT family acetyltransferase
MRTFKQEDISKILDLMKICFKDEIERGMELPNPSILSSKVQREEVILLVEEVGTKIIAFTVIRVESVESPALIRLLAVDPGHQRNGIGTRLVEASLDLSREHDWKKLKVNTRPWNTPMRKILTNFQFIPEGYLRKEFLGEDIITYAFFR